MSLHISNTLRGILLVWAAPTLSDQPSEFTAMYTPNVCIIQLSIGMYTYPLCDICHTTYSYLNPAAPAGEDVLELGLKPTWNTDREAITGTDDGFIIRFG